LLWRVAAELRVAQHGSHGARIGGGDRHIELRRVGVAAGADQKGVAVGEGHISTHQVYLRASSFTVI